MKNKKRILLIAIAFLILALTACTNGKEENKSSVGETDKSQQEINNEDKVDSTDDYENKPNFFIGTIEEINGEVALVSIEKGEILKSGSKVGVDLSVANDKTFQIGNKVKVGYDGII
ncbi:MAG TPA: hypothetical protein VK031_00865, partial [Tissierellaceae bacterium]|nr:hypothetical protein [Tissierellaceae bacterium]